MKKLTKILHARRHHDRDQPHPASITATLSRESTSSSLHEAPTLHQLTPSRRLLTRRSTAPSPSTTSSHFFAGGRRSTSIDNNPDSAGDHGTSDSNSNPGLVCSTCAETSFPSLMDWQPGQPRPWVSLSHVVRRDTATGAYTSSQCPYCAFFRAVLAHDNDTSRTPPLPANGVTKSDRDRDAKFAPYLRIRLAFERLGVRERHPLGQSVLIEVMARSKSLPWGYIVKAAGADGSSMAGYGGAGAGDEAGDDDAEAIRGRRVTSLLDPALPRTWLDFCRERHAGHDACARPDVGPVQGIRLIDVEARRLVEGKGEEEYVALSHAWEGTEDKVKVNGDEANGDKTNGTGDDKPDSDKADGQETQDKVNGDKTQQGNTETQDSKANDTETQADSAEANGNKETEAGNTNADPQTEPQTDNAETNSIDPNDLNTPPPLINDALKLTADLGFKYLWVDRYCLPPPTDDAQTQPLDLVGDIFARSALALVVAGNTNTNTDTNSSDISSDTATHAPGSEGIPGVSVPREPQLTLSTSRGLFTTTLLRPDLDVADSAWASRCHTYQEGLLARRRLVLTPSQAYFQCGSVHCHESLSVPLVHATTATTDSAPDLGDLDLGRVFPPDGAGSHTADLASRVHEYMARTGSPPSQRLDAFRGMLHHYRHRLPAPELPLDSIAGLPLAHPDAFCSDGVVSQTDRLAAAIAWRVVPARASKTTSSSTAAAAAAAPAYVLDAASHAVFPSWTWLAWRAPATARRRHTLRLLPEGVPGAVAVAAPPSMELSLGFDDGALLSWEIDGEAAARRPAQSLRFLRVRSYTAAVTVRRSPLPPKKEVPPPPPPPANKRTGLRTRGRTDIKKAESDADSDAAAAEPDDLSLVGISLPAAQTAAIKQWFRAAVPAPQETTEKEQKEKQEADEKKEVDTPLTAIMVCGTNWRSEGTASPTALPREVTLLVCRPVADGETTRLVRLGALTVPYTTLAQDEKKATLEGVPLDDGAKGTVAFTLDEVDVY